MKISELHINPKNPRKITDAKLDQLKRSMQEFGDLSGIIFNHVTSQIVGGHQRTKVFDKGEIVLTKNYDKPTKHGTTAIGYILYNGERFSYREVKWDKHRQMAATLAANRNAGEWDLPEVGNWLKELGSFDVNFDLDLTMFDETERKEVLPEVSKEGLCDADEVPESRSTSIRLGDLYLLGSHRLLCGDSTSASDVARLMNGEKADMVFTDPPYGISLVTDNRKTSGSMKNAARTAYREDLKVNQFRAIVGDDGPFDPSLLLNIPCKELFIFGGNNFADKLPRGGWVCWDRKLTESADRSLSSDFELCWSKDIHKFSMIRITWHGPFGHGKVDDGAKKVHPSQKPVKLAETFIEKWGKDCKNVIDLFLGSGSTLIACEKTNRKCYGMEIDPVYCQVIIDRWEKFTGKKAVKVKTVLRKKTG